MRIVVLDYSGHIPQADLARNIAKLGHEVRHIHCSDYVSGRGVVDLMEDDPLSLEFIRVSINSKYNRYNPIERINHEIRISSVIWSKIKEFSPDKTIISNVPLFSMYLLAHQMRKKQSQYLYWWQDVYSFALTSKLKNRRLCGIGINKLLINLEKYILRNSIVTVAISKNFESIYLNWGLDRAKLFVYPNWTPVSLFSNGVVINEESTRNLAVYAGTLGMKHNPQILIDLADNSEFKQLDGKVIVVSEGQGRVFLEKTENLRKNIILRDFMPIQTLNELFSEATILLAILEQDASNFSVPSKIMSYVSAGKPIIASLDKRNAGATVIRDSGAGIVVTPEFNSQSFIEASVMVMKDIDLRKKMRLNAINYANLNFNGSEAAKFFLELILK